MSLNIPIKQSGDDLYATEVNQIAEAIKTLENSGGGVAGTAQKGFYVTDSARNVAMKYDENGFDVAVLSNHFKSLLPAPEVTSASKWSGKTINALGDSITDFGQWVKAYKALTGCVFGYPEGKQESNSWGLSGSAFADSTGTSSTTVTARSLLMGDADLIILFCGTNDWGLKWATDLGSFSDRTAKTFCGGVHLTCQRLLEKYPNTPIAIFLPLHRRDEVYSLMSQPDTFTVNSDGLTVNHRGKTLDEYCDIIRRIGNHYSIRIIETRENSRMSAFTDDYKTWYNADGIHLNDAGGKRIAQFVYPILEQLYVEFYGNK